jgi:hypothetical protein
MNNPIKSHMNTRTVSSRLFRFETAVRTATPTAANVHSSLFAIPAGGLPRSAHAARVRCALTSGGEVTTAIGRP